MVYLAITKEGLYEAIEIAKVTGTSIWCGADAISEEDFKQLSIKNLTRLNYPLMTASEETITGAMYTIEDHHPDERIWVEGIARSNLPLNSGKHTRRQLKR